MPNTRSRYHVPMLAHGLELLEALAAEGVALRLVDVAARIGVGKTTAFRILATLEAERYVERRDRLYRAGDRLRALAADGDGGGTLPGAARPFARALRDRFGETVNVAALRDGRIVYVDVRESDHQFRVSAQVGDEAPLHASALGKCLLAHQPDAEVARLLGRGALRAFTPRTITDRARLRATLAAVRRRGHATDDEEVELGASCIAAPIFAAHGRVSFAISVAGPTARIAPAGARIAAALAETTRALADRLRAAASPR